MDCTVNGLVCEPNSCNAHNVIGAVSDADYTNCDGKSSGETCTPKCLPEYKISTAPEPITLACDTSGAFDGFNELVCDEACLPGFSSNTGTGICAPFFAEARTKFSCAKDAKQPSCSMKQQSGNTSQENSIMKSVTHVQLH